MSFIVPLQTLPNQNLSLVLDGFVYDLTIKTAGNITAVTIMRDQVTILTGFRAVAETPLIPYGYLEQGNFIFLTENDELPFYEKFNVSQTLIYYTQDELSALRG